MSKFESFDLRFDLPMKLAVRLRFLSFMTALLCFLDAGVRLPAIAPQYWSPAGPLGPVLDFLYKNLGAEFLIQLQDVSRTIIYVGLALAAIGLRPRLTATVGAAAMLVFFSLFASARGMRHSDPPLILSLFISAITPWPSRGDRRPSVDLWPVHLQRFLFAYVFFTAGVEKLIGNPDGWIGGDVISSTLRWVQLGYAHRFPNQIQLSANQMVALFPNDLLKATGPIVVLLEVCGPILLYFRRSQGYAYFALTSLLVVFRIILFVPFSGFYALVIYWLPGFNPRQKSEL